MAKIEKLPSGNYRIREVVGHTPDKKPIRKSFTASDKMTLRRLVADYEPGKEDAPMLLDAMDAFVASRVAVCSPYTVMGYRNILRGLKSLTEASVRSDAPSASFQSIINALVDAGKSPKTIRNYAGLISASVKYAGFRPPVLTLPSRTKKEMFIPDQKTMKCVLKAVEGSRLEVPVALGMMGLRRGEVCAAAAEDVKKGVLHISRAAVEIDGVVTEKAPKTFHSDRYVKLPPKIAKRIQKEGRATDLTPSQLSDQFAIMLRKNGLPHFRFHDLRHFFVSYCHNVLKLSDAQIQKLGGYRSDFVMKRYYLHSMEDNDAMTKAAEGIGSLL